MKTRIAAQDPNVTLTATRTFKIGIQPPLARVSSSPWGSSKPISISSSKNKSISRNVPLRGTKYIGQLIQTMDDQYADKSEIESRKPVGNKQWVLGKKVQKPYTSSFEKLNL